MSWQLTALAAKLLLHPTQPSPHPRRIVAGQQAVRGKDAVAQKTGHPAATSFPIIADIRGGT